ncbi:hypothetical protein U9M48_001814 [Paspalum notatum var. saurae]|uniref:Uncharacterized protein n=1 Tax=Paspalum notatum var. saurae TaxID=547442 RepID=A0AAQ3PPI5_PASNO
MPHIARLLGRFKLGKQYLAAKSSLQTIAGFVTDDDPRFKMLMDHMKQLRKGKIWAIWRDSNG